MLPCGSGNRQLKMDDLLFAETSVRTSSCEVSVGEYTGSEE